LLLFTRLYRDAQSTKHKIYWHIGVFRIPRTFTCNFGMA
jgi:hypothetical protein